MKKTDIGVVAFMYIVCLWFGLMNAGLPADAQIYPKFIICILAALTTLYLIKILLQARKEGVTSGVAELFKGFLPRQFLPILGFAIGYLVLLFLIGFYPASVIFMVSVLAFLKIKKTTIGIATLAIMTIVFVTFNVVLKVNLIKGLLFEAIF